MCKDLIEILRSECRAHGPITFRRFTEQALYNPDHGYYASGKAAIGCRGDFFTSVSVGPLFGRLMAMRFEEIWKRLGRPDEFTVVEQGAAGGEFAHDVLSAASGEFGAAIRYVIIEPFPVLAARQRRLLGCFPQVSWRSSPAELDPFDGIHFSNELLDAMPVNLVVFRGGEWRELYVTAALEFTSGPLSTRELEEELKHAAPPEIEGYTTEIRCGLREWTASLATNLRRGAVIAIDYGYFREVYYTPDRTRGTLQCHSAHRRSENPLVSPGEIDITAHVDFTQVSRHAEAAGFRAELTDQHRFLAGLATALFTEGTPPEPRIAAAFRTLMHPELLGSPFKVLLLTRGLPAAVSR
jgi:SAM-dependent MidA family methyltransferase